MLSHRHARHVHMKIPRSPQEEKKAPWYRKKNRGREERYERPLPATPTHPLHLAHALYRGYTRYDKEVCYRTDTLDTYI